MRPSAAAARRPTGVSLAERSARADVGDDAMESER
jgi:hypothetical protein